jgi:hypothetical protein
MKAAVLEIGGRPAGLVAYTGDSRAFHAAATQRYLGLVIWETLCSALLSPRIVAGFPSALRLLRDRREEPAEARDRIAEILALGVLPEFLTPALARVSRVRPADLLLGRALADLKAAGCREARGVVLAENRPALVYFRMRASRIEPYLNTDRPSYQVWFDLEHPRLPQGGSPGTMT